MTWKLQSVTGELMGETINIERDMLVGRHQDADVVLQSAEISRRHAALLLKDNVLWVQDLNSSNGTYVNDVRIANETLLKNEDTVQFASLKFSVIQSAETAAAVDDVIENTVHVEFIESETIEQPAEAIATSEYVAEPAAELKIEEFPQHTPAETMNTTGMPSLTERAVETVVTSEGMPEHVAIPKPAPIPEGVDVKAKPPVPMVTPEVDPVVNPQQQEQKNASVGLIAIVTLIILAIIAWLFFK
ncbi:FHA domain-containing protein [Acinetobacter sp. ANC 4648]|uniref:FHA domain-containing protein n=1 Tax=Acinetobacter sp. ANC 4648 TaxID=1977875 RepID=UPI000A342CCD|nr:FHA domain-containing protein [Acinetobacter sp. ANC 4648]OTG81114.1 FHA domain-containing protein [Acinetobacter sp. ANC 4648]